jgi:hypothetical protein
MHRDEKFHLVISTSSPRCHLPWPLGTITVVAESRPEEEEEEEPRGRWRGGNDIIAPL